jgi:hypothetical protein
MKKIAARILIPIATASVLLGLAGGVASAAPVVQDTPIWALPGLDVGGLLGPLVQAPTELLAPIYGILTLIS